MQIFMLPFFPIAHHSIDQENECRDKTDSCVWYGAACGNGCSARTKLRKFSYFDVNPALFQAQGDLIHGGRGHPGIRQQFHVHPFFLEFLDGLAASH